MNKNKLMEKLGAFNRVESMESARGNAVANQFEIFFQNGNMFQSYDSIIAIVFYFGDVIYLGEHWNYSKTTSKYRNMFLRMEKPELEEKIREGKAVIVEGMC